MSGDTYIATLASNLANAHLVKEQMTDHNLFLFDGGTTMIVTFPLNYFLIGGLALFFWWQTRYTRI